MDSVPPEAVPGFAVPVHRALTEHILLGGAPRGLAIANATLAGAVGLGLRARRDPQFVDVARRHLRFPNYLQV
jgi:type IV secretory pathway TrbD component